MTPSMWGEGVHALTPPAMGDLQEKLTAYTQQLEQVCGILRAGMLHSRSCVLFFYSKILNEKQGTLLGRGHLSPG